MDHYAGTMTFYLESQEMRHGGLDRVIVVTASGLFDNYTILRTIELARMPEPMNTKDEYGGQLKNGTGLVGNGTVASA